MCQQGMAQRWTLGGGLGATMYKGELNDWHLIPKLSQLKTANTAVHMQVRYQEKQAVAFRGVLTFTGIDGDGANNALPSTGYSLNRFSSPLIEAAALVDYNFLDYQSNRKVRNWTPYVYAGLGFLFVSPKGTGVTPKTFFTSAIPFGLGIKYQLTPRMGIQWEMGTSKSLTNILDGQISMGESPSIFTLKQTDQYLHSSISLTYTLVSVFCPRE